MPHFVVPPPGIYTPLLPFHHNYHNDDPISNSNATPEIDLHATLSHISRLAKAGIMGLVISCPNESLPEIYAAECVSLMRTIRAHLNGLGYSAFTILASTNASSVQRALDEIDEVQSGGADFALLFPPRTKSGMLNGPAVMGFIHDVVQSSSLPILTCNLNSSSVRDGIETASDAIMRFILPEPKIVGWKPTCSNANKMSRIVGTFSPVPGPCSLDFILPALEAGAQGIVVSLANTVPKLFVRLFELLREGDMSGVRRLQRELSQAGEALGETGDEGVETLIARCYGYGGGKNRRISTSSTEVPIRMDGDIYSIKIVRRLLEIEDRLG